MTAAEHEYRFLVFQNDGLFHLHTSEVQGKQLLAGSCSPGLLPAQTFGHATASNLSGRNGRDAWILTGSRRLPLTLPP